MFGCGKLRLGLLQVLGRRSLAFMEVANALLGDNSQIVLRACLASGGLGGDEVVLRDQLLGAVDFQQRIALLDPIAELGNQAGHPAGERRQDDRGGILIISDLADRRSLRAKRKRLNLRDLQLMHLIGDDPDKVRKPDVSFIRAGRLPNDRAPAGWVHIPPDLAVEVLSPGDTAYEVDEKLREYQSVGVLLIWVVNPKTKTVRIHRPQGDPLGPISILSESDTITGERVLEGFTCPVAEFFRI